MKYAAEIRLPDGYRLSESIDLVKNRRQMLLVNGLALLLAALVAMLGIVIQPQSADETWDLASDPLVFALKCGVTVIALLSYVVGHEAVHGVFMWRFSRQKPHFGLSFTYAYAGSPVFFGKGAYLIIALAPVIVWGTVLGALSFAVPPVWFWPVWLVQISNLSGAAGDFYVFFRILSKPDTVLVQDIGTAMSVYLPA